MSLPTSHAHGDNQSIPLNTTHVISSKSLLDYNELSTALDTKHYARGTSRIHLVNMSCRNTQVSKNVPGRIIPMQTTYQSSVRLIEWYHVAATRKGISMRSAKDATEKTDPASWTVTKVMLPPPKLPPFALRTVPAALPDCKVIHCSVGAVVNSSRKSVSRTSSQRSLPYKGVNNHPFSSRRGGLTT